MACDRVDLRKCTLSELPEKKGKQAPQEGSDPQYEQTSTGCIATCGKSKSGQPEHVGTPKAAALPVQAFLWDTILIISCHFLKTK